MHSLSDYSIIGNCRSAALVSKHGSIDWCCVPDFDSPAIFSHLLDSVQGGFFSIQPVGDYKSFQRYIEDTNVIETIYETPSGEAVLTDLFVAQTEDQKRRTLFPDHEILRVVQCTSGTVQFKMEFEPRLFYGMFEAELLKIKMFGIKFSFCESTFFLQSSKGFEKMNINRRRATDTFFLTRNQSITYSLSCSAQAPAIIPEVTISSKTRISDTIDYWKKWLEQCKYNGPYREHVRRSALVLKLLAHAPSGSIVAAPTTSLPEELGGTRNWDYRYCWLRDASFTIRALLKLGFDQEANAYLNWILHATQLTHPELQVVYSIYGRTQIHEKELGWLRGFKNSRPVRIGNGAHRQRQLDVYGEVLDAFFAYSDVVSNFDRSSQRFMIGLCDEICRSWKRPDHGIWESRSLPAHHTHSKVMSWVGLDRLIKLSEKYRWKNVNTQKYREVMARIENVIEEEGFNSQINAYTSTLNGTTVDSSSLVFSLVEFCRASSPRMESTTNRIRECLSRNNLLYRYRNFNDGIAGGEGAFGICNFWLVENLCKLGKIKDATAVFEQMLNCASGTGLLSEEIDPLTGELLGNYPQGFTHIGLINAALSINDFYKSGGNHEYR